jgi:hypothetical protein
MTTLSSAIATVQALIAADGAQLQIVEESPLAVHFRLDLSDAACADCVLPAAHLTRVVTDSLRRDTGNEALVVAIDDPRETS